MILISNNVQQYMKTPDNAVIRINMAWIKCLSDLETIVMKNARRKIFLDYPQGRSKPPRPLLTLDNAYHLMKYYQHIKYFAVSNIEEINTVKSIQERIPKWTEFVPKIETEKGVMNLENLIKECNIKTIMLDKEDLFVDVEEDNTEFYKDIDYVRLICKNLKVNLLELQGVVFIGGE